MCKIVNMILDVVLSSQLICYTSKYLSTSLFSVSGHLVCLQNLDYFLSEGRSEEA